MLSKSERLPRADFEKVFKHSKSCFSRLFVCRWIANEHRHSRFAVVVSSNICPLAVDRNHKRRQSYEIIRYHHIPVPYNLDIILFAKKNLASASFKEIKKDLVYLFDRILLDSGRKNQISQNSRTQ